MSSLFRVDGLISGLDTSTIISQMMALERRPMQLLQRQQTTIKAKQAAWNDLAARMRALQGATAELLERATLLGNSVSFRSSSPALTATASADAVPGTYSISIVQLATHTVVRSVAPLSADLVSSDLLSEANLRTPITAGTFSINGVTVTVDPTADSLDDVIARINASDAGVTAGLVTVDGRQRLTLTADTPGGPLQLGATGDTSNFLAATQVLAAPRSGDTITGMGAIAGLNTSAALQEAGLATPVSGSGVLTINDVEIHYDTELDTLSTIINKINNAAAGVTASYNSTTDRFELKSKQTGSLAVSISDTGNLLSALGIDSPAAQHVGQNAAYSLDGGATLRYSTTNTVTDALPGITLTLTRTTTEPEEFTVGPDIDKAINAVKRFVDQFNSIFGAIRERTAYNPETETGSILLGDPSARSLAATLRSQIISPATGMEGAFTLLSQVGISFGAIGSEVGTTNTLKLDEEKLRAALIERPQAVFDLFAATPGARTVRAGDITAVTGRPEGLPHGGRFEIESDGAGNLTARFYDASGTLVSTSTETISAGGTNTTLIPGVTLHAAQTLTGASSTVAVTTGYGVLASLNDTINEALGSNGVFKIRDTGADTQIRQLDEQIRRMQDRIDRRETALIRQFTVMETTLAKMQAQSNALLMQLAGLMGPGMGGTY